MENTGYILIQEVMVEDVNAQANQYIIGFPAITSLTGYGYMQERLFNEKNTDESLAITGVAIISHAFQLHEGHSKNPPALQGTHWTPSSANKMDPPIIAEAKADMTISLIFELSSDDEPDDVLESFEKHCCKTVPASFISGGHCRSVEKIVKFHDLNDLWRFLKREKISGDFLQERPDLLQGRGNRDALDSVLHAMTLNQRKDEQNQYWSRNQMGWIVPIAVGYQAVEKPRQRDNVRKNKLHVYAEPLTGIGEFTSLKKLAYQYADTEEKENPNIFWKHAANEEYGLYYTTTD